MTSYGRLLYDLHGKPWMGSAVHKWLPAAIKTYPGDAPASMWRKRLVDEMREEYGNPLLIIILVPIAQLLIKYLIEWLLERRENRDLMMQWHYASQG